MRFCCLLSVLLGLAVLSMGCQSAPVVEGDADTLPRPFEITLHGSGTDGRHVHYELSADGTLHFGGGRQATGRNSEPVGKLTDEQRMALWSIIRDERMLTAAGQGWGAKPQRIKHEVVLVAGSRRHRFTTIDDQTPGPKQLDEAMFKLQADVRYATLFNRIDHAIDAGVGTKQR